ncbi:hypothetical protein AB4Z21_00875 [Paenibacillus sp. MCAF20]
MFSYDQLINMHRDELVSEFRTLQNDHIRSVEAADRLQDNAILLERENKRLMDEVDEAREAKKVMLPRDVAEAIEQEKRSHGGDCDYLAWHIARDRNETDSDTIALLKNRAAGSDKEAFINLVLALKYGYTIEQPEIDREQRLRLDVRQLMDTWDGRSKRELVENVDELLSDYFEEIKT